MEMSWTESDRLRLPEGALAPMQQHPIYGVACEALGSGLRHFELTGAKGEILASAQVLERPVPCLGRAALLSRGPVWAPNQPANWRRARLVSLLDQLRCDHRVVAVTPDPVDGSDPLTGSGWLNAMSPCHFASLDLSGTQVEMRARQHGKWRNRLVKAEAAGLRVHHGPMPADPGHWLLKCEAGQARARRYKRLPSEFTTAWIRAGGKGAARVFTAEAGGEVVAAMLFLLHGSGASYHIGWSGAAGRQSGAHTLLLWQAQLWLAARGVRQLDLDLIDTHTTPGLARFKLGSGANLVKLGATRLSAPGTRFFAGSFRANGKSATTRPVAP